MVVEAKMFSNLSAGTKKVPAYNRAVRHVACVAWSIVKSGKAVSTFNSLGSLLSPRMGRTTQHARHQGMNGRR